MKNGVRIEINTSNAAFAEGEFGYELKIILDNLAHRVEDFREDETFNLSIFDTNGNYVGYCCRVRDEE